MKLITSEILDELTSCAGESDRKRSNYNIHESSSDPVQRLIIAAKMDSYFRPHKHTLSWEMAIVVRGLFDVLIFDEDGVVVNRVAVGQAADNLGFELQKDTIHTWIPVVEDSVFIEVKKGPYDPETSAVFPEWAPEENSEKAPEFMHSLQCAKTGDCVSI